MTFNNKTELRSTVADSKRDFPQRALWCAVINAAATRAVGTGEGTSLAFFRSEHFETLCFFLRLDAVAIRERVLRQGFATLNRDRSNN